MRILVAEDNVVFQRLLETNLKAWGYEVVLAVDGTEAWKILSGPNAPQLAILDWMMPGFSGIELCKKIRQEGREAYTYVILLTAMHGDEELVIGMEAGANDYITKPFKPAELRVRLRAGRQIIELQNDLLQTREALRIKATHDPLTGLWNHEEIFRLLDLELFRAERQKVSVGIILADIDHFKKINDTFGHLAGDHALRTVAQEMQALVRSYDAVGRYGGDEFLLVLPGCDRAKLVTLAERLRNSLREKKTESPRGPISLTLSLGAVVYEGQKGADATALLHDTDTALYSAKHAGRDRLVIADDQPAATPPSA
ncbi:MAG: diguanylate cyclase [Kiritimatiellaeota bacterium]|nr:diguanylate cyclase [Kiritimatiellota bacterium]